MNGATIGMKSFGASAPLKDLQKKFGFTADAVYRGGEGPDRQEQGEVNRITGASPVPDDWYTGDFRHERTGRVRLPHRPAALAILDIGGRGPASRPRPTRRAHGLYPSPKTSPADRDYPPFDKSLMDVYAVRAADDRTTKHRPIFQLVGEVAAGQQPTRPSAPAKPSPS